MLDHLREALRALGTTPLCDRFQRTFAVFRQIVDILDLEQFPVAGFKEHGNDNTAFERPFL
jgi:hypothetical protein